MDINLQEGQNGREKFLRRSKKRRHLPKIWTEKWKDRPTDRHCGSLESYTSKKI